MSPWSRPMGFEADSSKSSSTSVIARPEDWLVGGGEMGKLIRSMDWTKTPLGPIEFWPQSLRTTVSLCLASNFPISLVWGPNHVQIYNDGYWPICGGKPPLSMGQDFTEWWAAPWPVIGEAFERAAAGETSYLENQRMFLDRNGYLEETCFTFSFSPIRDETGGRRWPVPSGDRDHEQDAERAAHPCLARPGSVCWKSANDRGSLYARRADARGLRTGSSLCVVLSVRHLGQRSPTDCEQRIANGNVGKSGKSEFEGVATVGLAHGGIGSLQPDTTFH